MKKENGKKITIIMIVVLALVCILACFLILNPISNNNNENNNNTNENNSSGELKELEKDNMFAIYVQKNVGGTEYDEIESNTWPDGFVFNKGKSYCIDEDGNPITTEINLSYNSNKVFVSNISQTSYCFLYFNYEASGLTFYLNGGKNSVTNNRNTSWRMDWTVSDPVSYCVSTTNSSTGCTWTNFPTGVTTYYSNNIVLPDVQGNYTYYGFLKDSSGNIFSDSDTITYNPTITTPDPTPTPDPEPSGSAPTCSLSVSTSGVTLSKSSDATEYGLVRGSSSPNYNSISSQSLTTGEFYGFVKNAYGTGTCHASVVSTAVEDLSTTRYTWNESTCQVTSTSNTYNCCKAATSTTTPGSCPSGMVDTSSSSFCNGQPCCRSSSSIATPTTTYSNWSQSSVSNNSTSCTGSTGDLTKVEISNKKTKYNWSVTVLCKCATKSYTNTGTSDSSSGAYSACYSSIDFACTTNHNPDCQAPTNSPSCSVTQSTTCTRTTYTRKETGHTCSKGSYYEGGCYSFAAKGSSSTTYTCPSGDTKSGSGSSTQCCHTSSTKSSGCVLSSSKSNYGFVASGSGSGDSCPSSASTCNANTVGSKQISNCESHKSGGVYYFCGGDYSKLNDSYCYKIG